MKSKLPANFLISLKKGSVKISENKKPAIEFSTKNDDRVVNIISIPVKISGKKSAIKRLGDARDLAKTLKKEGVTLDIQHNGKLVLRLGEKAKPKLSKIITLSGNIEIADINALRSLEKGVWWLAFKFKQEKKPIDVYPTLWMLVALSCLVGSIIGKSLS